MSLLDEKEVISSEYLNPGRMQIQRTPSSAYMASVNENKKRVSNVGLPEDEYKKYVLPEDKVVEHNRLTAGQKIGIIGYGTTLMSYILFAFGIGVLIAAFVAISYTDTAFILFIVIGACAFIPGTYAVYVCLGKFFGWPGYEKSLLPSNSKG